MWVARQDLPRTAANPFYTRLNQILEKAGFDGYVEVALSAILRRRDRPAWSPTRPEQRTSDCRERRVRRRRTTKDPRYNVPSSVGY